MAWTNEVHVAWGAGDPQETSASPPVATLEERALTGDRHAWNQLVARHDRRVWVSLLAMGAAPDVAAEVVQETWLRLYERCTEGRLDHLKLPGLAVVQARFLYLHRVGRLARESDEEVPDEADLTPDAERRMAASEELQRVMEALEACTPRQRELMRAVYEEGATAAEAASRFGLSVQRVRQSVCEIRAVLRTALGGGR